MENKKHKKIIAAALASEIAIGSTGCNRAVVDIKYGLNTAVIYGNDTAIAVDLHDWRDYEGEQYQLETDDGLIMLGASFDTDLSFGTSSTYTPTTIAQNALSENGEFYNLSNNKNTLFNYEVLDLDWKYNKATLFNKDKACLFNILKWKSYEGEQIQIVTNDKLVMVLSSYNSKLFYDKQSTMKAEDFSQMYIGKNGKLTEFGDEVDIKSIINYQLIDLQYEYNKVIIFKDNSAIILPVKEWADYEGEQLQVKINGGPIILTSASDSIILDDSKSKIKADEVASAIVDNVIDLTEGKVIAPGFFNKTIVDLVFGFSNAVISNDNSSATIPIKKWSDYKGEQLQVILPNGDVMLSSSIFLDFVDEGNDYLNVSLLSNYYSDEKVIEKATDLYKDEKYNKQIIDLHYKFNYALHVENGNVSILPLKKWRPYENNNKKTKTETHERPDGTKYETTKTEEEASPNCELILLELPDGSALLTSSYDTILLKTDNIEEYAELFRGADGVITNLTPVLGEPNVKGWNIKIFDTNWKFNYAIYNFGTNSQIFDISRWIDYVDGQQVQLYFKDGGGLLSSYTNSTLVYSKNEEIVQAIASAFAGEEKSKGRVIKYK